MAELKKNLAWVGAFALIAAVCTVVIACRAKTAPLGKTAKILSDGKTVRVVDLENVKDPYEFTVASKDGGENTVRVENGRIAVTGASCPDKICVKRGFISGTQPPIVCLPNKLTVVVSGDNGGIDAVTGGDAQ